MPSLLPAMAEIDIRSTAPYRENMGQKRELKKLSLAREGISTLGGDSLRGFSSLTSLDLSRNRLDSLKGLEDLMQLRELNLFHNCLSDQAEIGRLTCLKVLSILDLRLNPLTRVRGCRRKVIRALPQLERLDERVVMQDEGGHGADEASGDEESLASNGSWSSSGSGGGGNRGNGASSSNRGRELNGSNHSHRHSQSHSHSRLIVTPRTSHTNGRSRYQNIEDAGDNRKALFRGESHAESSGGADDWRHDEGEGSELSKMGLELRSLLLEVERHGKGSVELEQRLGREAEAAAPADGAAEGDDDVSEEDEEEEQSLLREVLQAIEGTPEPPGSHRLSQDRADQLSSAASMPSSQVAQSKGGSPPPLRLSWTEFLKSSLELGPGGSNYEGAGGAASKPTLPTRIPGESAAVEGAASTATNGVSAHGSAGGEAEKGLSNRGSSIPSDQGTSLAAGSSIKAAAARRLTALEAAVEELTAQNQWLRAELSAAQRREREVTAAAGGAALGMLRSSHEALLASQAELLKQLQSAKAAREGDLAQSQSNFDQLRSYYETMRLRCTCSGWDAREPAEADVDGARSQGSSIAIAGGAAVAAASGPDASTYGEEGSAAEAFGLG
ncbi:unnamed protein product [Chrysoparadoxa australica]